MAKLYELTGEWLMFHEMLENDETNSEMLKNALEFKEDEIEEKAENIAKMIRNYESDAEACKQESERFKEKQKTAENKAKFLKEMLQNAMEITNKKKFKRGLFSFNIQKNPASVNVLDENAIPDKYFITERKLVKKDLLSDLKAGTEITGAEIKQSESLRIR